MTVMSYEDVVATVAPQAARQVAKQYGRFGVTERDAQQEIWVWLLQEGRDGLTGEDRVRSWLDESPQWVTSIRRAMVRYASKYGKQLKAERSGYEVYDNVLYSDKAVTELLVLAQDETFDGSFAPREGFAGTSWSEELVAMVMDVRRAIQHTKSTHVSTLVNYLNEESRQHVGSRKRMSNATAIVLTGDSS